MEGDFLERAIAVVAAFWVVSALVLAWIAFLAPAWIGRAARVSLLLVAAATLVGSTIALGGIWTAPAAVLAAATAAYFGITRR